MLNKYLKVNYTDKIRESLILPSFWELTEPCDWKAVSYLSDLYEKDPLLSKRLAHSHLSKDANVLKKLIIPGTIAETMLNILCRFNETKGGKATLKRFYEVADDFKHSGIRQKSAKAVLKSSMMQEVAHEEEKRVQKKLKISAAASSNDDDSIISKSDVEEDETDTRSNIWQDWKEFLNDPQNTKYLPPLSPEKHGVIWYGIDLRRRLSLPENLYTRLRYETTPIKQYNICDSYKEPIKNIIQSTNRNCMLEYIEVLRSTEGSTTEKKTLVDLFLLFGEDIYDDVGVTLFESETCLNNSLIKPCLKICSRMLRNRNYDITYMPGETELSAMTEQLNKQGLLDNRFKYYADGKVRVNTDKQELLLLEVSSALNQATQDKIAFDHTKAMFGLLAILKTLACKNSHGSFELFKKIKFHFIHVHGHAIRHWTMMTPEPGVYIMTKEQKATIPVNINSMADDLISYVRFLLNLTESLRETLDGIEELKKEHRSQLQEVTINNEEISAETLLSSVINPVIIRLNEGKHSKEVLDSPQSGTNSPQR